jgi:hypothetical protein
MGMSLIARWAARRRWGRMARDAGPAAPADVVRQYPFASWAVAQIGTLVDAWIADGRDPRGLRSDLGAWRMQIDDVKTQLIAMGLLPVVADEIRALDRSPDGRLRLLREVMNLPFSDDEARAVWRVIRASWAPTAASSTDRF